MFDKIELNEAEAADKDMLGDPGDHAVECYRGCRFRGMSHDDAIAEAAAHTPLEMMWREDEDGYRTSAVLLLTLKENDDVETLAPEQFQRYGVLRFDNGQSHNLAIMLATREGPAGVVKGSRPTPKLGCATGDNTLGGGKIIGLKRRYA